GAAMPHRCEGDAGPDRERRRRASGQKLDRNVALVVVHGEKGIETAAPEQHVCACRPLDRDPCRAEPLGGRRGDSLVIVAKQAAFSRVWIDAEHPDPWVLDTERDKRRDTGLASRLDQL